MCAASLQEPAGREQARGSLRLCPPAPSCLRVPTLGERGGMRRGRKGKGLLSQLWVGKEAVPCEAEFYPGCMQRGQGELTCWNEASTRLEGNMFL